MGVVLAALPVAVLGQAVPAPARGSPASWAAKTERTPGGPEADLVVRTGDINNLGFGWPPGFDPFSGKATPPHGYPWTPPSGAPEGTDRIMLGSAVTPADVSKRPGDGYASSTKRADTMPQPVTLAVGALPATVKDVLVQMFLDDFQSSVWKSQFQVSLNGTRIPSFERAVNSLQQTGPIGKLVSLKLMPEYWPLLRSGTVKLVIDDPTTHAPDGYAIDFVRILVNPHPSKFEVTLRSSVVDEKTRTPIAGATVEAALGTTSTDPNGRCVLKGIPAGLVIARASAAGYDEAVLPVDLVAGQTGDANFTLRRHQESTAALERAISETGSAAVYGIHFDVNSAKLRPDSDAALAAVLELVKARPGSRWIISGHTDNQGTADLNQRLSAARAASVAAWLNARGVGSERLIPNGFGSSRPIADNATENGRALNRRVEIAPAT